MNPVQIELAKVGQQLVLAQAAIEVGDEREARAALRQIGKHARSAKRQIADDEDNASF